jgi:hypothetical protein
MGTIVSYKMTITDAGSKPTLKVPWVEFIDTFTIPIFMNKL